MRIDLFEYRVDGLNVFLHTKICRINNVQQQGRLTSLLQSGLKRRHQVVRQMTDKPYGIRQHGFTDIRNVYSTKRRIQGREQLIRCVDLGFGYLVEQGGFSGVGIPHQ